MQYSALREFGLKHIPVVGPIIGILTYVLCIIVAIASKTYIGGTSIPYFSDTGRGITT